MHRPFLLATLFTLSPLLAAQQGPKVGERVADVTFPQLLNGDGRQKLSDFHGQPIVIDLWGTH